MATFRRAKREYILDKNEFNSLIEDAKNRCIIRLGKKPSNESLSYRAYIWQDNFYVYLLARFKGKAKEYAFPLTENYTQTETTGGKAFAILSQYVKIQRVNDAKSIGSASAVLYKNEKYAGQRVNAYEYDINSAFAYQMLEPIPNIETLKSRTYLKEGQIGFIQKMNKNKTRITLEIGFEVGKFYRYTCDLMESPFKKFVKNWYEKKKKAKTKQDRQKAKEVLNFSIGAMQNYNPFLRACIIGRSNMYIKQFIDKNTIYANTDSIVSLVPREDIEKNIGIEIGQWKKEHYGDLFAWQKEGMNYQWNDETPVYRGIPKRRFDNFYKEKGKKFDILLDEAPIDDNSYIFNYLTLQVEENKYEKKKKTNKTK